MPYSMTALDDLRTETLAMMKADHKAGYARHYVLVMDMLWEIWDRVGRDTLPLDIDVWHAAWAYEGLPRHEARFIPCPWIHVRGKEPAATLLAPYRALLRQ